MSAQWCNHAVAVVRHQAVQRYDAHFNATWRLSMAFSELERRRIEKALSAFVERRRPPAHLRAQIDIGSQVVGQSVEIFEQRPAWRGAPGEIMRNPVAKATYVKRTDTWKVYWHRADQRWHAYEPAAEVDSVEGFLAVVDRDAHACFWG